MINLSIIIVNFNTKKLSLDCIKSIYSNKPQISFEVIVVDNGSTDGSVEVFEKLENIKVIRNNKNLGFARAVNIGIKNAKGKNILLLNSDTKVKKGAIDKLVNFAKENSNVGAVSAKLVNPDGSVQKSIFHFPTVTGAFKEFYLSQKGSYQKYLPRTKKPVKVDVAVMTAFLITPVGFKNAGLLNERYFMYFEDLDYCRKLHSKGLKVVYLPNAEVVHYHGASGKDLVENKNQWRRLIPSSKIYHGLFKHYLINLIIWSGQKWQKLITSSKNFLPKDV